LELDVVHGGVNRGRSPSMIGATGDQMMELTGEIATALSSLLRAARVQRSGTGAAEQGAGQDQAASLRNFDRPQLIVCSVDLDARPGN